MPKTLSSSIISAIEGGQGRNFEPFRTNLNELIIQDLPGADTLTLSVESGAFPSFNIDPITLGFGNDEIHLAGRIHVDPLQFTFRDFADPDTLGVLKEWHYQHYNPETGKMGLASVYKKKALLNKFLPDGSYFKSFFVIGIWMQTTNLGQIDQTTADRSLLEITFQADRVWLPNQRK